MMNIGVQTFTIRKYQKKNLYNSIKKLVDLGFNSFELARIKFNRKNALIIKELIKDFNINIVSIQAKPKDVFNHKEQLIEFCKLVNCENIILSMLPFKCILGNDNDFYDFLITLDPLYDEYMNSGIELGYHHHNWEYTKLDNGKFIMDELLEKTNRIKFVHDTYWTTKSGRSSSEQIISFDKRLLGVHLRDINFYRKNIKVLSKDTELGNGIINFNDVIEKAKYAKYLVIEQKTKTPYERLNKSMEYIKGIICKK